MFCLFLLLAVFVDYSIESSKVIVLPKNPSKVSKYVPEGQQPNAITDALDKGNRFAIVGGELVEVHWSENIRCFHVKHLAQQWGATHKRMFVVLFASLQCPHCPEAVDVFEELAASYKDYFDFCGIDITQKNELTWFTEKFSDFTLSYIPYFMIVRPNAQKTSGWEWFTYRGERTPEEMGAAFSEMLPSRVKLLRYDAPEQCTHINDLQHAMHPTLPTLIGFSKRLKFVPAFMKTLSEDLKGLIAVRQINPVDEMPGPCVLMFDRGLGVRRTPTLVLTRPASTFRIDDPKSYTHFRLLKNDTWSNGAVRRWLDHTWSEMQLGAPDDKLGSRFMIPKYRDPKLVQQMEKSIFEKTLSTLYNAEVEIRLDMYGKLEPGSQDESDHEGDATSTPRLPKESFVDPLHHNTIIDVNAKKHNERLRKKKFREAERAKKEREQPSKVSKDDL